MGYNQRNKKVALLFLVRYLASQTYWDIKADLQCWNNENSKAKYEETPTMNFFGLEGVGSKTCIAVNISNGSNNTSTSFLKIKYFF